MYTLASPEDTSKQLGLIMLAWKSVSLLKVCATTSSMVLQDLKRYSKE